MSINWAFAYAEDFVSINTFSSLLVMAHTRSYVVCKSNIVLFRKIVNSITICLFKILLLEFNIVRLNLIWILLPIFSSVLRFANFANSIFSKRSLWMLAVLFKSFFNMTLSTSTHYILGACIKFLRIVLSASSLLNDLRRELARRRSLKYSWRARPFSPNGTLLLRSTKW